MADKLGLGPEVRELKIGDSFSSNKLAFHTLRYDFKPASVVSASKHASIEVGQNQQITVTHLETAGAPQTVFKGSQRPYHKECVLIIDRTTGDITLEKLSTNIQLKKTRQESQRPTGYLNSQRPPTPVEKKPSPPGRNGNSSGKNRNVTGGAKHSPIHASPSYPTRSPHMTTGISTMHKSPPQVHITASSPTPAANSLPILDEFNDNSSSSFDISAALNHPEIKTSPDFSNISLNDDEGPSEVGILSDSSSSSSTDSNSSDSESDTNDKPSTNAKPVNGHVNGKSSPLLPSMPSERLLNEDLQLSESGSDSD
ncbi:ELL-associated factor isoform X2 [Rhodnius prolixus]|uniref:Ell-associated factor Eaf n=2 Tax=Rhodnius TaxID=13248 RepID=A0A4P6D6M7_RHOPR